MNTQENNKLIAEFMGVGELYEAQSSNQWNQYHESWDSLMPVVEKIELTRIDNDYDLQNFFSVMIEVFECNINGGDICICKSGHTKRDATYKAVVEFINEYNKNK